MLCCACGWIIGGGWGQWEPPRAIRDEGGRHYRYLVVRRGRNWASPPRLVIWIVYGHEDNTRGPRRGIQFTIGPGH